MSHAASTGLLYDCAVTADEITIRMRLVPEVVMGHAGSPVTVLRLPVKVGWSRKAASLSEVGGGEPVSAYVGHVARISAQEFDAFAARLLADAPPWLVAANRALPHLRGRFAAVLVVAPARPLLLVDCEGFSYARYVARVA